MAQAVYHSNLQCPLPLSQEECSTRRQPAHCPESLLHNALVRKLCLSTDVPCYNLPLLPLLFQTAPRAVPARSRSSTANCTAASLQASVPPRPRTPAGSGRSARPSRRSSLLLGKAPGSCANRPSEGSTAPRRDTDVATPTRRYQDAPEAPLPTPQPRAATAPIGSRPGAVAAATVTAKGGRFPGPGPACPRPGWVRAAGRRDGGVPGARGGR